MTAITIDRLHRRTFALAAAVLVVAASGCTHTHLRKSNGAQVGSLTELLYEQTLSNVAMAYCQPGSLPHVAVINSGSTQATTSASGAVGLTWNPTRLVSEALNLNSSRTLAEAWSVAPVTSPSRLRRIQCALSLMTKGYEIAVVEVPQEDGQSQFAVELTGDSACSDCLSQLTSVSFLPRPDITKLDPITGNFKASVDADAYRSQLTEEMKCKLPTCWYGIDDGMHFWWRPCHKSTYHGCCGKYTAWVDSCGIPSLARATLSIQELGLIDPPTIQVQKSIKVDDKTTITVTGLAGGTIGDFRASQFSRSFSSAEGATPNAVGIFEESLFNRSPEMSRENLPPPIPPGNLTPVVIPTIPPQSTLF